MGPCFGGWAENGLRKGYKDSELGAHATDSWDVFGLNFDSRLSPKLVDGHKPLNLRIHRPKQRLLHCTLRSKEP